MAIHHQQSETQLLEHGLQRRHEAPNELVDDATFLRRAYLNVVGRIPTLSETETFLADQDAQKRDKLCDQLLDSQGRTSHFANFWFDLLRVKSRQRQLSGEPFAHFLRESIQHGGDLFGRVLEVVVDGDDYRMLRRTNSAQ